MKYFLMAVLLCSLGLTQMAAGQVINTEKNRKDGSNDGWDGEFDVGFAYTKNTKEIMQLTSGANVQYTNKAHTLLLLSDLRVMSVDRDNIQNRGFQHVRYNYEFKPFIIPEAFVQAQYNQVWKIDLRVLAGAGPRFRILHTDSSRIYLGTLVMYEYEDISDGLENNRDIRLSTYASAGFQVNDRFGVDHITYFQPRIDFFPDFRISSETSMKFSISTRLAFKTGFSINYDSRPPDDLVNTFVAWRNSLAFNF